MQLEGIGMRMKINGVIGLVLVGMAWARLSATAEAADAPSASKFGAAWGGLIGEWKGEGPTGAGSGACGFRYDLSGNVIVRTNHAELTGRTAAHDDLMVIYPGTGPGKVSAMYFDNEGHVIEYAGEWSAAGDSLTFVSKPGPGPQFRLTYKKVNAETWTVNFEMAPPGQPGAFKPYTSGKLRRNSK
jgi:hypothetical protein